MSGQGRIWRSILWIERFLPTPAAPLSTPERSVAARRSAADVPLVVGLAILVPALLRNRHDVGTMLRENIVLFQQVFLGLIIVSALAVVIAGVVTWRREDRRGGTIER